MANFQDVVNDLQIRQQRSFAGLSDSNHLSAHFFSQPHQMNAIMSHALGKWKHNNLLDELTSGAGNMVEIGNREYDWKIHGNPNIVTSIVEECNNGDAPGIGDSHFHFKTADRYFERTDNVVFDDGTQARIEYDPEIEGGYYKYTCKKTDPSLPFIDNDMLKEGRRVSKDYSTVGEYSDRGGDVHFNSPLQLRNQLTILRKSHTITGSAASDNVVIEFPDPRNSNKSIKTWMTYAEYQFMAQAKAEIQRYYIYSRYNKTPDGYIHTRDENGRPIPHGAGLRQQIASANRRFYTQLTYSLLEDFLMSLSYQNSEYGGETKFLILTGKQGMIEFDRAMRREMNNQGLQVTDAGTFIAGSGQDLTFQGQFRHVKMLNGIEATVQVFDPYDDIERHRQLHPKTKRPIESYRMTVMNIGRNGKTGQSNLRKVYKQGRYDKYWYVPGSTSPLGNQKNNKVSSTGKDGYDVHYLCECGLMLSDPLTCGELIYDLSIY